MYKIDLHGQRFGHWTAVSYAGNKFWNVRCDCGLEATRLGTLLRGGKTTGCSKCVNQRLAKRRIQDYSGEKHNRWTFIRRLPDGHWIAKCECGHEDRVFAPNIRRGQSKGCERCAHRRLPGKQSAINKVLREYKDGAKRRGLVWDLTPEAFETLIREDCVYCGKSPTDEPVTLLQAGRYTEPLSYNGIDRLNNSDGYTSGNAVSCCTICNRAKRELSIGAFTVWLDRIKSHKPTNVAASSHLHISAILQLRNA